VKSQELPIHAVHLAVLDSIRRVHADRPELAPRDVVTMVLSSLRVTCPTCGPFASDRAALVAMAGSGTRIEAVGLGGDDRVLARGSCPGCHGSRVLIRFES
jgi:hypothetical protein